MKVFISWSDERSEALAKGLREWFPLVLHFVEPWLSRSDIQAGERWGVEIAKELENCNFGVICITRENMNSPWILFETGALAKSMEDGRVIPLLLDVDFKEISGPLAQFQAKKADNGGIKELVISLNKAASVPIPDAQLEKLFAALWGDLEKQIASIPKSGTPVKQTRPQGDILEELVSSIRSVEKRIHEGMYEDTSVRRHRRRHLHPMMKEMMHRLTDGPRDPIQILFMASLLRDDAPWVYELALEAYRLLRTGHSEEALKAYRQFIDAIEILRRGPFLEDLGVDHRMIMDILRFDSSEMFESSNSESGDGPLYRRDPAKLRERMLRERMVRDPEVKE